MLETPSMGNRPDANSVRSGRSVRQFQKLTSPCALDERRSPVTAALRCVQPSFCEKCPYVPRPGASPFLAELRSRRNERLEAANETGNSMRRAVSGVNSVPRAP